MREISKCKITDSVIALVNSLSGIKGKEINQFSHDLFYTDEPVEEHTDSTGEGKITVILTLVNEAEASLKQNGESLLLEPGMIITFDARQPHSLDFRNEGKRWAALIWDLFPNYYTHEDLIIEFNKRMEILGKEYRTWFQRQLRSVE